MYVDWGTLLFWAAILAAGAGWYGYFKGRNDEKEMQERWRREDAIYRSNPPQLDDEVRQVQADVARFWADTKKDKK